MGKTKYYTICIEFQERGGRHGRCFIEKIIIAKPWRNTLLRQVKSYIDNNLNPAKVNVIDPAKDNFTQQLSVKEILDELEISKDDYCRALSISKDLEMHLRRGPNFCFVNNYFDVGLKAWQANMDIQPVFNEYKAVTYMCQYFSKTEDRCSQAMKQAPKEAFQKNMHHHGTIKTIAKAYLSN